MNAFNTAGEYDAYDDQDAQLRRRWAGEPCVIYVRISHADVVAVRKARAAPDSDAERDALLAKVEAHLARCETFARRAGLDVKARFREDNMSASALRPRRGGQLVPLPQRTALIGYLDGLESNIVVLTTELSRLYRDSAESQEMIDQGIRFNQLPARAAHLVILDVAETKYDLATDDGRKNFRAGVNDAEAEAKTIGRRRRAKERDRAEAGLYFGRRPFGYTQDTDPATGTLNGLLSIKDGLGDDPGDNRPGANPGVDEAAMVRAAAARVLAEAAASPGRSPSLYAIAAEWNAAGVTTSRGGKWTGGTVALLLTRPLLAGWRLHLPGSTDGRPPRGRRPRPHRGRWEAILDQATFDAVGTILADPRRTMNTGGGNQLATSLASLAFCGACGTRLVSAPMRPGRTDRRLKCAVLGCSKVARAVTPVEAYTRKLVLAWRDGPAYASYLAGLRATAGQAAAAGRAGELAAQIAAVDADIGQWVADLARPGVTAARRAAFGEVIDRLSGQRDALDADLRAAERQAAVSGGETGGPVPDWVRDPARWARADAADRRDWLRQYVAKVIIYPNPPGTPRHWFDPAIVEVIPGPWAKDVDPGELAAPAGLTVVVRPPAAPPRHCDLDGCGRDHEANGLCHLHNRRQWEAARAGHPDQWDRSPAPHRGRPAPGAGPRLCDLDGCGREHEAGGLCDMHRARKRTAERNGTPDDWDRSPAAHRGRGPGKGLPRGSAARPPAEPKLCATGDGQPVEADGLCGMHYRRKRTAVRNGTPDDWDRSPGARRGYSGGRGKPRGPRRPA